VLLLLNMLLLLPSPRPRSPLLFCCRYENTERRKAKVEALGLRYMGMGVSGGEEGARRGARF
jgi:hypothetical protein